MQPTPFRFLVITDHRVHKESNPIYYLLPALHQHPQCAGIDILSRGNPANEAFFEGRSQDVLTVRRVQTDFGFLPPSQWLREPHHLTRLSDYDAILMRLARPVSTEFLHFLAKLTNGQTVINHPLGIEKTSSKAFLLHFPDVCPPMKLCRSAEEVRSFAAQFPIVLKPLRDYGGKGLVRIEQNQAESGGQTVPLTDFLRDNQSFIEQEGYLAMKFLHNVTQGDKRIIVVNGKIMAASLRMPPKDSWLCNVAQGGSSQAAEADEQERAIIARINPALHEAGIFIYGVDTLVDDQGQRILSEINTLSIGGFLNAEQQSDLPVIALTIQQIINNVYAQYS